MSLGVRPGGREVLALAVAVAGLVACDGARVEHPDRLWLLWLVPLAALALVVARRRALRRLTRFADRALLRRLGVGGRPRSAGWGAALRLVAFAALLLALAGLQVGFDWEEVSREGVDLVVAVDVSDSMLAQDGDASEGLARIERARRELVDLVGLLGGDRVGLVAFSGTAFLECPLTLDHGAFALFVDHLDTDLIPTEGTDLGAALEVALDAFESSSNGSRAILLLTDGEDHGGRVMQVAQRTREEDVPIFVIGIGSEAGAPIRDRRGFRKDGSGEMVLSRLDEKTLQSVALATGGVYVRSVSGDLDLERVYLEGVRATLQARELESRRRRRWHDRFQWLLGLAVAALMVEGLRP